MPGRPAGNWRWRVTPDQPVERSSAGAARLHLAVPPRAGGEEVTIKVCSRRRIGSGSRQTSASVRPEFWRIPLPTPVLEREPIDICLDRSSFVRCARLDPVFEQFQFVRCHARPCLLGRHLVEVDQFDEQALVGVPWFDGRPGVPSFEHGRTGAQIELPAAPPVAVTLIALRFQDRQDAAAKVDGAAFRRVRLDNRQGGQAQATAARSTASARMRNSRREKGFAATPLERGEARECRRSNRRGGDVDVAVDVRQDAVVPDEARALPAARSASARCRSSCRRGRRRGGSSPGRRSS